MEKTKIFYPVLTIIRDAVILAERPQGPQGSWSNSSTFCYSDQIHNFMIFTTKD